MRTKLLKLSCNLFISLGVEPVDDEIIKKKPRSVKEGMVNTRLVIQMVSAATFMVMGTLFIFWKEVNIFHQSYFRIRKNFMLSNSSFS